MGIEKELQIKEAARIISSGSSMPDISRINTLFQSYLEEISSAAGYKRHHYTSFFEDYAWELKAISYLFREAKDMLDSISCDCNLNDYKKSVLKALKRKDDSNDWGWGSNWPDHIHTRVMSDLRAKINLFLRHLIGCG